MCKINGIISQVPLTGGSATQALGSGTVATQATTNPPANASILSSTSALNAVAGSQGAQGPTALEGAAQLPGNEHILSLLKTLSQLIQELLQRLTGPSSPPNAGVGGDPTQHSGFEVKDPTKLPDIGFGRPLSNAVDFMPLDTAKIRARYGTPDSSGIHMPRAIIELQVDRHMARMESGNYDVFDLRAVNAYEKETQRLIKQLVPTLSPDDQAAYRQIKIGQLVQESTRVMADLFVDIKRPPGISSGVSEHVKAILKALDEVAPQGMEQLRADLADTVAADAGDTAAKARLRAAVDGLVDEARFTNRQHRVYDPVLGPGPAPFSGPGDRIGPDAFAKVYSVPGSQNGPAAWYQPVPERISQMNRSIYRASRINNDRINNDPIVLNVMRFSNGKYEIDASQVTITMLREAISGASAADMTAIQQYYHRSIAGSLAMSVVGVVSRASNPEFKIANSLSEKGAENILALINELWGSQPPAGVAKMVGDVNDIRAAEKGDQNAIARLKTRVAELERAVPVVLT